MSVSATRSLMLLGRCVPSTIQNAAKVEVERLELDKNLLMYFRKRETVYAHDPEERCKSGDVVLIKLLPQKLTRQITHTIMEVVYPLGDITDPITGKKVVVGQYREDIKERNKMYGENKSGFKYDEAPERGWQEDKKDFTHRESYIKYHVFENDDQPYAV